MAGWRESLRVAGRVRRSTRRRMRSSASRSRPFATSAPGPRLRRDPGSHLRPHLRPDPGSHLRPHLRPDLRARLRRDRASAAMRLVAQLPRAIRLLSEATDDKSPANSLAAVVAMSLAGRDACAHARARLCAHTPAPTHTHARVHPLSRPHTRTSARVRSQASRRAARGCRTAWRRLCGTRRRPRASLAAPLCGCVGACKEAGTRARARTHIPVPLPRIRLHS
jgi:hypothetical protein